MRHSFEGGLWDRLAAVYASAMRIMIIYSHTPFLYFLFIDFFKKRDAPPPSAAPVLALNDIRANLPPISPVQSPPVSKYSQPRLYYPEIPGYEGIRILEKVIQSCKHIVQCMFVLGNSLPDCEGTGLRGTSVGDLTICRYLI